MNTNKKRLQQLEAAVEKGLFNRDESLFNLALEARRNLKYFLTYGRMSDNQAATVMAAMVKVKK